MPCVRGFSFGVSGFECGSPGSKRCPEQPVQFTLLYTVRKGICAARAEGCANGCMQVGMYKGEVR